MQHVWTGNRCNCDPAHHPVADTHSDRRRNVGGVVAAHSLNAAICPRDGGTSRAQFCSHAHLNTHYFPRPFVLVRRELSRALSIVAQ